MSATLGDLAAWYDELGFVGRQSELDVVQRLLDQVDGRILLVHGPGGIGKSALLREVARRARRAGRPVVSIDLRDATPAPEVLAPVRDAATHERPVITIDTFEHVAALSGHLRTDVLPVLPIGALVVIATRARPDNAWSSSEWERLTTSMPLAPLSVPDSTRLLASRGLVEPRAVQQALRWTGGNPLGLALAAEQAERAIADGMLPPAEVAAQLTRRLLDTADQPAYEHTRALVVASIARVTTPELLRAVLDDPGAADEAWRWLTARSFIAGSGDGVAPHELLSRALRTQVRVESPELERALRRRVVDTLAADALAGGTTATADLVHLVDNAAIRWGFGVNSTTHHLDVLRDADLPALRAEPRMRPYRSMLEHWLEVETPGAYVVRRADGALRGFGLAFSTAGAPERAWADRYVGPRLTHARRHFSGPALVWSCAVSFEDDPAGAVQGLLGVGGYLATDTPNPVASYIPINPAKAQALAFAHAVSATRAAELDTRLDDDSPVEVHVINHGPAGMVEHIHRTVYAELGLPASAPMPSRTDDRRPLDIEDVRTALRVLHSDALLAATPLAWWLGAADLGTVDRARRVREHLALAIGAAWPDRTGDEYRALDLAYLRPQPGNAAAHLHMSRSSWFRVLRRAVVGVAEHLDGSRPGRGY